MRLVQNIFEKDGFCKVTDIFFLKCGAVYMDRIPENKHPKKKDASFCNHYALNVRNLIACFTENVVLSLILSTE